MQEKINVTKTDEQGGIEFFNLNLSIGEVLFRELVEMYHLTAQRETKAQGSNYLTYSNSEGKGLAWGINAIKVKGYKPYIVINDLRSLENTGESAFPNNEEDARKELTLYGIETSFTDNTDTSNIQR
jgi:hypothetical protein